MRIIGRAKQMQAAGEDVVSFGAGEPDFDTPDFIKDIAIADLKKGRTKYTDARGGAELLDAVRVALKRDYNLEYATSDILVSVGGKHSLYNIFQTIVEKGDEVIIPSPYWVSYPDQVISAEGTPVIVKGGPEQGLKITPAQLDAAITPRTVAFVFNSPSNPTGAVYSKEEIAALAEVLRRHPHVNIISDDLYQRLVYAPAEFHSILAIAPDLKDRTVIVNGWSKAYSMTGWRLGWLAGPTALVKAMSNLQSHSTSNVTTFCQNAAREAILSDHAFLGPWMAEFDARRRLMVDGLNAIPGISCKPAPMGAFYAFPDVSRVFGRTIGGKEITGSTAFAEAALEDAKVSVIPGIGFGEDRCVRLSYATSRETIAKGLAQLGEWLKG
jgi:aspartate aminotransferase